MIYICTKFHMLSPNSSLFSAIKLRENKISNMKAILILLPKTTDVRVAGFSKVYYHKSFQEQKLSGACVILHVKSLCIHLTVSLLQEIKYPVAYVHISFM
jgi:hypothetical protein